MRWCSRSNPTLYILAKTLSVNSRESWTWKPFCKGSARASATSPPGGDKISSTLSTARSKRSEWQREGDVWAVAEDRRLGKARPHVLQDLNRSNSRRTRRMILTTGPIEMINDRQRGARPSPKVAPKTSCKSSWEMSDGRSVCHSEGCFARRGIASG